MARVPSIIPVSDLRQGAAAVIAKAQRSKQPLVITQRGRAAAVMMSMEAYQEGERELELLRRIATGEREIKKGKGHDLDDVMSAVDRLLKP